MASFDSCYYKSSLHMLYGGMRKSLFIDEHPTKGVSAEGIGIKVGRAFYDLNKQILEYKSHGTRVKACFGADQLFNMKMKIGEKVKGQTRNNIQFGTDDSHFDSDNQVSKLSIGGMFSYNLAGIGATTRFKFFSDQAVETFTSATVGGARVGCDMRATLEGSYCGFVGASIGLPQSPILSGAHVGSVVELPSMRPSFGLFGVLPRQLAPNLAKMTVGMEVINSEPNVWVTQCGAEVAIDNDNSVIAKLQNDSVAHISFIKHFQGMDVRMGVKANLSKGTCGNYGVEVTLNH